MRNKIISILRSVYDTEGVTTIQDEQAADKLMQLMCDVSAVIYYEKHFEPPIDRYISSTQSILRAKDELLSDGCFTLDNINNSISKLE